MQMQVGAAVIPADDLFQLLIADADKGVTHTAFVDRSLTFVRVCLCRSVPVSVPLDGQRHWICDVHYVCVCTHTHDSYSHTRTCAQVFIGRGRQRAPGQRQGQASDDAARGPPSPVQRWAPCGQTAAATAAIDCCSGSAAPNPKQPAVC